jgi:hypothetical protein
VPFALRAFAVVAFKTITTRKIKLPCIVKVAVSADNPRSLSSLAFPRILAETDRGNVGLIDLAVASFCFVVFLLLFVARLWPPRASFQICGIKGVVLLHNDTLGAASGLLLAMVHIHRLGRAIGARETAAAGGVALHLAVVSSDLANNVVKGLLNIQTRLGGSLDELAAERTSQSLSICRNVSKDRVYNRVRHGGKVMRGQKLITNLAWRPHARPRDRTCCRRQPWGSSPCP